MSYLPVLRYILSDTNLVMHVEFMPRVGINNITRFTHKKFDAVLAGPHQLVVDSRFYSICLAGDGGYVLMKEIVDSDKYTGEFETGWD